MRKVIYTEFNGINCSVEKEGLFHGFFQNAIENNDGGVETFTEALIEIEDGSIVNVYPPYIRFIDKPEEKPEAEQLAEFAKAAMQGLLSNQDLVERLEQNGELFHDLVCDSISLANIMIAELNKPQE